jgi:multidrug transporter EmrE-like cation transporter
MTFGTPPISIACFLAAALLGALGQFLYKTGADASDGTVAGYVLNARLAIGVVCYVAVMVLFVAGFRHGGRIDILYPVYATTFIWAALISWAAFGTPITALNVLGMLLLVIAIGLIGAGGMK